MSSAKSPNARFNVYLRASYKYYITEEETGLSDYEYDLLCHTLKKDWDDITHPHKHLATIEDMGCGTGFSIKKEDYPEDIR